MGDLREVRIKSGVREFRHYVVPFANAVDATIRPLPTPETTPICTSYYPAPYCPHDYWLRWGMF